MKTRAASSHATRNCLLRWAAFSVAAMWLLAMIVTDGLETGTTGNIITDAATAQQIILDHQGVIVVEAMSSFYLAAALVTFAAAFRHALASTVAATAAFGGAVLSAVAIMLGAAVSFAELAAAHHHDTTALTTFGYFQAFAWTWQGVTWGFFLLAAGTAILTAKSGPRWFAIVTLVLGTVVVIGFGAVLFWGLAPVWFALVGFLTKPRVDVTKDRSTSEDAALPIGS